MKDNTYSKVEMEKNDMQIILSFHINHAMKQL